MEGGGAPGDAPGADGFGSGVLQQRRRQAAAAAAAAAKRGSGGGEEEGSESSEEEEEDGGGGGGQQGGASGRVQELLDGYFGRDDQLSADDRFLKRYILKKACWRGGWWDVWVGGCAVLWLVGCGCMGLLCEFSWLCGMRKGGGRVGWKRATALEPVPSPRAVLSCRRAGWRRATTTSPRGRRGGAAPRWTTRRTSSLWSRQARGGVGVGQAGGLFCSRQLRGMRQGG